MSPPSLPVKSIDDSATAHNDVTLDLAKKESAHHLGKEMDDLYSMMRNRALTIKAYRISDPNSPTAAENVKTVHFVRHGQGFHNLMADMAHEAGRDWTQFVASSSNPYVTPELLDPPLTEKGRRQANILRHIIKNLNPLPELIVLSSQCRALQTGIISFQDLLSKGVPFIAHEMAREESGVHICDKRRSKSFQMLEFPQIDFSLLEHEEDMIFSDVGRESKLDVGERIYRFFDWLEKRKESHVGVVSHSGWLMTFFNGICECDEGLKGWFQTGEMRSVKLVFNRR